MASHVDAHPTWTKLSAFQVFGDYSPMRGFRVLVRVGAEPEALLEALEARAATHDLLDPELARALLRSGLGLLRTGLVRLAYATTEEALLLLHADAVDGEGAAIAAQNRLLADYAASLSLLLGRPLAAHAQIFEVPDLAVARRGLVALCADVEEGTPLRSAMWLGAQLRGRGQPFHPSMVETLEEQSHLLQTHGVDMDALPTWWWRGVLATHDVEGIDVYDELPGGEELGHLVPEA